VITLLRSAAAKQVHVDSMSPPAVEGEGKVALSLLQVLSWWPASQGGGVIATAVAALTHLGGRGGAQWTGSFAKEGGSFSSVRQPAARAG
jgi:hypothetical protein